MLQKPADFLLRLISKPLRSKIMSLFESHRQITHRVIPQSKHRGYIKVKTCRQSVVNKVPTILTYNNHDILLKKKSAFIIGTQIQLLHCGEMGCSVFEASVFCAKYYLVQVKKWEESGMFDKKFKRESSKWISMTCFSDHAEKVVFSTYSISALVLYSAN